MDIENWATFTVFITAIIFFLVVLKEKTLTTLQDEEDELVELGLHIKLQTIERENGF